MIADVANELAMMARQEAVWDKQIADATRAKEAEAKKVADAAAAVKIRTATWKREEQARKKLLKKRQAEKEQEKEAALLEKREAQP